MLQLGQIDRADDEPPYRQIASMLRDSIISGPVEAGGRLPSEASRRSSTP
ncbi:GntR family transcriptional regulator [Mycolicibacterium farcinogenes]|nr:GntR family transcriptional regulator [Mycolicibacterium farcinogenes]